MLDRHLAWRSRRSRLCWRSRPSQWPVRKPSSRRNARPPLRCSTPPRPPRHTADSTRRYTIARSAAAQRSTCPSQSSPPSRSSHCAPWASDNGVERGGALVAKDREGAADGAGRLVMAVAARRVVIDACAGHRGDRPFHRANDLAERNLARRARQRVAALGSAGALDQSGPLQIQHDQLEIFGRHSLRFGDAAELHRAVAAGSSARNSSERSA